MLAAFHLLSRLGAWRRGLMLGATALLAACATAPRLIELDYGEGRLRAARTDEGVCRIVLDGRINATFETHFRKVLHDVEQHGCRSYLVSLNSGGGQIAPALRVGRLIRAQGMHTEIAAGTTTRCASACGFLFIAGVQRSAKARMGDEPASRELGFHQASRRVDGQRVCATEETIRPALSQQLQAYTRDMLPPEGAQVMMQLLMETDCRRMRYLDAAELLRLGIATRAER